MSEEPAVAEVCSPVAERLCLMPSDTDNRIVVELRVVEIVKSHRFVERICEVVDPAECVRIDIDDLAFQESLFCLVVAARTICEHTTDIHTRLVKFLIGSTICSLVRVERVLLRIVIDVVTEICVPILIVKHAHVQVNRTVVIIAGVDFKEERTEGLLYLFVL